MKSSTCLVSLIGIAAACLPPTSIRAESFADGVVAYVPGSNASLIDPTAALGKPGPGVPGFPGFNNAETLNPFNSHFEATELTQIGPGGSLVLRLEKYVEIGMGPELGVFGNVGLIEAADNTALDPAVLFGNDEVRIEVSETGRDGEWAVLNSGNRVSIANPVAYFTDDNGHTGPSELVADLLPELAAFTQSNFGKPFVNPQGALVYSGKTIAQIASLFDGSAGGDWFDLDGLQVKGQPLTRVGFVRFSDPQDPDPVFGGNDLFELMAVSINANLSGSEVPVPEPYSGVLLVSMLVVFHQARCLRN